MIVVFDSLTGQGKRFAHKLGYECIDINSYTHTDDEICLITRSWGFGKVTNETYNFLKEHHKQVIGVAVTGNKNWGANYGAAGHKINDEFAIPLILKFEASGLDEDVIYVKEWLAEYLRRGQNDQ